MLSRDLIGTPMVSASIIAEAGQMRFFARATGQTDRIFFDDAAAQAAGYRAIIGPPTLGYALQQLSGCDPFELFERIGVRLEDTLHGEQHFTYGALICAGDTIAFAGCVIDIATRKSGALDFLTTEVRGTNQFGHEVVRAISTTIVVVR